MRYKILGEHVLRILMSYQQISWNKMINIINPFALYALSFIGAFGIIWSMKFSNNQTLRKLTPINNLRQTLVLILLTNFLVIVYLIIHANFIYKMLIEPGFIEWSVGMDEGFYWKDDLGVWNQQKLNNYEIFKFIKELVFVCINIFVFFLAMFLRKRNNLKIATGISQKPNLAFTVLLIFFCLILTNITLYAVLSTVGNFFIWEGG